MLPTTAPDRPTLAPAVETLLGTLRRRIRQYIWLEGCAAAVAWLGVAFWLTLAADWFFEPPPAVRCGDARGGCGRPGGGRRAADRPADLRPHHRRQRGYGARTPLPALNDSLLTAVVLSGADVSVCPIGTDVAGRQECLPCQTQDDLSREMLAQTCQEAARTRRRGRSLAGVQSASAVAALQRGGAADDQRGFLCNHVFHAIWRLGAADAGDVRRSRGRATPGWK